MLTVSERDRAILVGCLEGETPRIHADQDVIAAWTECGTEALWVIIHGTEQHVFSRYREMLEHQYGRRDADPGKVWSSWYSYYEKISRAYVDAIVPNLPGLGFDTMQIDDGWERAVGDWEPNEKFSTGMRDAASSIRDHGMRPGLWLAPFITLPGSAEFSRHRSMLLRGADGAPVVAGSNWGADYFTFDFTRSDARDMLAELTDKVVHRWGFSYLKLDFINAGAVRGLRERDVDREVAYRDAISLIREVAGPGVYLLGSGAPIFPSLGVLDAVRTGPDVAPMWDNYATDDMSDAMALNALRNGVNRLWMRGLIGLDPDVVYFRRRRNLLSPEQMQALQDCATLSGFRAISDPPAWIEPNEFDAVREFLGPLPRTEQLGRHRFRIGERTVDFAPWLDSQSNAYPL